MSAVPALSVADPAVAGGALPGARLLGLVQRMMQAGMAMARHVNRIARQRLEGRALSRLGPAGFNATSAHYLVVGAVAWTAALRERLLAVAVRPSFVSARPQGLAHGLAQGLAGSARAPQGRGAADYLPDGPPDPTEDDWHDWKELAKPVRVGSGGVAVAARLMAGRSDRAVVAEICGMLSRAAAELGAEADVDRIAALAAAARALCPEVDAPAAGAGGCGGGADGGPQGSDAAMDAAEDDPAWKEPPD